MPWNWSYPHALSNRLRSHYRDCENLGLLLDKFTPYAEYQWKEYNRNTQQQESVTGWGIGEKDNEKLQWLDEAIQTGQTKNCKRAIDASVLRWVETVEHYGEELYFALRTAQPLIVGLGGEHVLETDITLDRNTGAPIIPGSALKGLTRHVALVNLVEQLVQEEMYAEGVPLLPSLDGLNNWLSQTTITPDGLYAVLGQQSPISDAIATQIDQFRLAFGTVGSAGHLNFFNGIYCGTKLPRLQVDIMTPHFSKYYTGNKAPSDSLKVVPIPYLVVTANQDFAFAIVPRTEQGRALWQDASQWLHTGLTEYGIGAKTAQGYGLFKG